MVPIYVRNGVEFISRTGKTIEAWAGGLDGTVKEGTGSRRRVVFTAEKGILHWSCTGNPKIPDLLQALRGRNARFKRCEPSKLSLNFWLVT